MTMDLSRRAALAVFAAPTAATLAPRIALAAAPTDRRFVFVVLRGALDGLATVPPWFDRDYAPLRAGLAPMAPGSAEGALDLDGRFGLHPALAQLHAMFRTGEAAIVHAVATPYRERSHFDAQDLLENGTTRARGASDGWLNRALALMDHGEQRIGLAVGHNVPLVLRGPVAVGSWAPQELPTPSPDFIALLGQLYTRDAPLARALQEARRTHAMAEDVLGEPRQAGSAGRGVDALPMTARALGRLLAAADGPRVATLEIGGWDTHAMQNARLAQMLRALDQSIATMRAALDATWQRTVVAVVTEFGRTVHRNGTGGTDHGTASIAMLIGGAVAGGRVLGTWPGLAEAKLHQGRDLAPTTDLRAVLKGVLLAHLGLPRQGLERSVFPGSGDAMPLAGLVKV
jgi:uncharacterized protein (DUF1501 family)